MTLIINLVALVLSAVFFVVSFQFPRLAADPGGLALFPRVAAVVTATACVLYLVQTAATRRLAYREHLQKFSECVTSGLARRRELVSFGLVLLLPVAIDYLGFVAGTFVFTFCLMVITNIRLMTAVVASLAVTAAVYIGYAYVLGAVLPRGTILG